MSLTKDKLITRLQAQVGLDKQESRQIVERLLGIMKDTLARGEELLISGFGKFSVKAKESASREKSSNQRKFGPGRSKSFSVQGIWGITQTHQ
jgi:integration host factor subunit alpha